MEQTNANTLTNLQVNINNSYPFKDKETPQLHT